MLKCFNCVDFSFFISSLKFSSVAIKKPKTKLNHFQHGISLFTSLQNIVPIVKNKTNTHLNEDVVCVCAS